MSPKRTPTKVHRLDVLVGLPGCGKTTFGEALEQSRKKDGFECRFVNMETIRNGPFGLRSDNEVAFLVCEHFQGFGFRTSPDPMKRSIIIENDEITSTKAFAKFISMYVKEGIIDFDEVVFHVWKPDRDACMYNVEGLASSDTIYKVEHQEYGICFDDTVEATFNCSISLEEHVTKKKPEFSHFCAANGIRLRGEKYMDSESWCAGGCVHTDDGLSYIGPEEPSPSFDKFEKLIDKLCPHIRLKAYRKLKECCTIELVADRYEETYHAYWSCDMERFYEIYKTIDVLSDTTAAVEVVKDTSNGDYIGTITFTGPTAADVHEQIMGFTVDEVL